MSPHMEPNVRNEYLKKKKKKKYSNFRSLVWVQSEAGEVANTNHNP